MIHWMTPAICDLIDRFQDSSRTHIPIYLTVCTGCREGHIEILCEVMCETETFLDLDDCTGLTNAEINARFVKEFAAFAVRYANDEGEMEYIGYYLKDLAEAMEKTLKKS